jgi:hypothetical protein
MGGHTNFIVNHTKIAKTTAWKNRVALILTATPFFWSLQELLQNKRVREGKHHGDTNANQESRVDQTSQQEHFGLQFVHQLRLTGGRFKVLAAHDADTDASADGAKTNNQTRCECYITEDVFHFVAPMDVDGKVGKGKGKSMSVVRLADVDQRQHHENEGLQSHDHDVEDSPDRPGNHVTDRQQNARQ